MDLSIIIVSWNTKQVLHDCLESVYQQTAGVDFEVIVVDNASSDGSPHMVAHNFPQATLVSNEDNRGFAAANNQGIQKASGEYVLLLNSDTIVLDNAISRTLEFAKQQNDTAVTGCKVLNQDGSLQRSCFMYPSLTNMFMSTFYLNKIFPRSTFFGREAMTWWDREDSREVEVVTGCFMLVKKEAIDRVGMMDEDYFMYGEETDWCYRFNKNGYKIRFTPEGQIIHLGGQSTRQVKPEMIIQLKLSILRFIRKQKGFFAHKVAAMLMIVFFALRLPVWSAIYLADQGRRKEAAIRHSAYLKGIKTVFLSAFAKE
ncbi:N-acetylglucosaminyl-diphospho-decaprenol L-rhamnosyltransferase [Anaerohalosphaera lusitana]|uniref:N-acetylglucosaminyl-diphospho-decaprenol L-rhamnosyltransferase n=1 Tax=Anaerohalosphaera lusitana TaxID=1936003 RepID=A0A1U9NNH2_9BACT|nr:glycosyltransferase family 2 protein [Anaerohalosphaera lusitana]AQT69453.1 N-acetylglucosaminyl-diphospho-decaprenol L-rhamnosyltransferase [Anaerohalosphaera lusitana]